MVMKMLGRGAFAIINAVVKEGLFEKVVFEQTHEEGHPIPLSLFPLAAHVEALAVPGLKGPPRSF